VTKLHIGFFTVKLLIQHCVILTLPQILRHEHRLSDLVNQAYRLTEEEIDLMWRTAPPRMPISRVI